MGKRLFDYNDLTGVTTWFHDGDGDTCHLEYVQDCEPILEANKVLRNDPDFSKDGIKNGWWQYGSIPVAIQMKWLIEEGIDVYNKHHMPRVLKKLNDREFQYLKTTDRTHAKVDH